jgi:phosphonate transport system permease protein
VRSAAVLGFFGYPTLGYHLTLSFGDGHFRETWTTIYLLLALILCLEWWSTAVRRRLVS